MSDFEARDVIEASVRRELFGPSDTDRFSGQGLDVREPVHFKTWKSTHGKWHELETGEEILTDVDPLKRYGVGVLYPRGVGSRSTHTESTTGTQGLPQDDAMGDSTGDSALLSPTSQPDTDSDDFDLRDANSFQPCAMAVTFRVEVSSGQDLRVDARFAHYEKVAAHIESSKRDWWIRRPMTMTASLSGEDVLESTGQLLTLGEVTMRDDLRATVRAYCRPIAGDPDPDSRLVTIVLLNNGSGAGASCALFQVSFDVFANGGAQVVPYPDVDESIGADHEESSIALLYRHKRTYAIGHGCAADWADPKDEGVTRVSAEPLPAYEVPSLTPDIFGIDSDGRRSAIRVSMHEVASGSELGDQQIDAVVCAYRSWIEERKSEIEGLPQRFHETARRHMSACDSVLARIVRGNRIRTTNAHAGRAFRLANESMLMQQIRSRLPIRKSSMDKAGIAKVEGPFPSVSSTPPDGIGYWRPFQIAFLLASLEEAIDKQSEDRNLVDLIFFPTGGGKTEAYLGAAAISMFARRLHDPNDWGTDVLMRYTLRLLTAQQFLRAAALICVMEDIRTRETDLGSIEFSIGIWLGGSTTPNRWAAAKSALTRMKSDSRSENPFLLLRCPWCGAQMGPVPKTSRGQEVFGYVPQGTSKVRFSCPDTSCRYGRKQGLPIHVVDEDIYESRPTLVIGTVDKFAMLAWQPDARGIFGIDANGSRSASPPSMIIQDELHLISGPLGSMVGLYEPIIEDLCTDYRFEIPVKPKIIASTATIRRYEKQVRDLYGRTRVALFPPHGLVEGESFFAEPAKTDEGELAKGRRYIGVMAPSLGSIQTVQVRVAASSLQGAMAIPEENRDGYWTNLNFLNSLRELGNTVSLLSSDIPDYLTGIRKREGIDPTSTRWPRVTMELTSRRRSDEIPRAIEQLELPYGSDRCVDVCLASNIIEVGVDIDRLSLMTIVGQPKTTAQYIQVSGRVGRRWWSRPGLVLTLYGAAKPRDRSHYEQFRSYHQRLYAQVEPTSLTPFALPVLLRGLHGASVAHIRQTEPDQLGPDPFPAQPFTHANALLRTRAAISDPDELESFDRVVARRTREWQHGERTKWSANSIGGDPAQGLMRFAGSASKGEAKVPIVWDTPTSMRTVDAECQLRITEAYAIESAAAESGVEE